MPDAKSFFNQIDVLANEIARDYADAVPSNLIDELDTLSATARRYHKAGVQLVTDAAIKAVEDLKADNERLKNTITALTRDRDHWQEEAEALSRLDGED
jgi:chaperonin cofactor prefoldin